MKGLARMPELFDHVRNAQRQIDEARSRIRKNEQDNRLDEAWIDKNKARYCPPEEDHDEGSAGR